ncbi:MULTISPECIES: hypothetical protein [Bradyrhizobium]|uniref:hypothetical protein n=1 Tax=Bradyrhizobium centrosematis TaxID=1300039 RepID=UPI0021680988|nr:hypothetical protein [Bradyrhizobium centrosematis]MCS3764790.1 hypothetical protein [Bradyrhizobium centrosematis]MCS3776158.1 hypothetical protein [Bradyrhizobium centrosematis]
MSKEVSQSLAWVALVFIDVRRLDVFRLDEKRNQIELVIRLDSHIGLVQRIKYIGGLAVPARNNPVGTGT